MPSSCSWLISPPLVSPRWLGRDSFFCVVRYSGAYVGLALGSCDGTADGAELGTTEGDAQGACDGDMLGVTDRDSRWCGGYRSRRRSCSRC
jgi:hypothetical protein